VRLGTTGQIESITIDHDGTREIIIVGELDAYAAPRLMDMLLRAMADDYRRVVVDLGAVSFADSSGVRPLAQAARLLQTEGTVRVRATRPNVRRVLDLTGVSELVRVEVAN
jgi:anti-sigma B factor antagonist